MPRKPDPTLRPAIVTKVARHLRDTKLENVSVRSLGRVLGTSAYPIVYHFGSRDALLQAVVDHLDAPVADATLEPGADVADLADYLVTVFGRLDDPDRCLAARLVFELGSVEALDGRDRERTFQREQIAALTAWCTAHGHHPDEAERVARGVVLAARGAQWGAVVDTSVDADAALREIAAQLASGARFATV